jgi:alanyl-tRNA synthetase
LYYRDARLREFRARVIDRASVNGRPAVELDRTAFYPTSGGQPHDQGWLDDARVIDVVDTGRVIQHILDRDPPGIGTQVAGRIDDARRFDHTQQHTGQHVLSQSFEVTAGLRTVSFHLGASSSTIDLDRAGVAVATVQEAEAIANRVVFNDRAILIHFVAADDVGRFGLRKPTEREGEIRIVEVDGFDRSACGGTHVERTGQIGPIKVRRWERRGETTRVEFLCGWRALGDYAARLETTRFLAERLSVADAELREAVVRSLDELEQTRDALSRASDGLLDAEAERLLANATPVLTDSSVRLVRAVFSDRSPDELKRLALRLIARPATIALLASSGNRTHLLFARSENVPSDVARLLRDVAPLVGARGGGTPALAQGGGPPSSEVEAALAAAVRLL